LHRGGIVGRAELVDIATGPIDFERTERLHFPMEERPRQRRWYFGGFALILRDVRPLWSFVACRGALGLFGLPDDIEAALPKA
jgi:hypothetical protein